MTGAGVPWLDRVARGGQPPHPRSILAKMKGALVLNPADAEFEAGLRAHLPEAVFRPLEPRYLEEPRGLFHGRAGLVLAPADTDEVARIVRACAAARVGIVPHGGGTGLVGGQVMAEGPAPVILSLERMRRIRAVYRGENVLVAEAGATLHAVQAAAADAGRLFPLSLASGGTAQLGGALATNAGGVNVLRYGNARALALGLEVVLPDGSVWHGLRRLRKDNTGYDLRDLMIGSEGTLGVITAATLRLFARPASVATALIVVPGPRAALDLLELAGDAAGEAVSAFELISGVGMGFLAEADLPARAPWPEPPDWAVLIELGLATDAPAILEGVFARALEAGLAQDGVLALSGAQRRALWEMREQIPDANRRIGAVASNDIALPLSVIPEFLEVAGAAIAAEGPFRINAFGHLGDGNLHYNIFPPKGKSRDDFPGAGARLRDLVTDLVVDFDGSFSAEHGIGRLKAATLERLGDPAALTAMRGIKAALDPAGIMNPGAVLG